MAQKWGNPEVREWMKEHKDEVEQIQQRYDRLKELSLSDLVALAQDNGADVSKVKDVLIAKIIVAESTR